jgi:Zn-dependent M16 (insulinase) family peptidase
MRFRAVMLRTLILAAIPMAGDAERISLAKPQSAPDGAAAGVSATGASAAGPGAAMLASLKQGSIVEGFRVEALYLNDADMAMGARFVHQKTGFIVDLLQIESVPQAFTWVNTYPVSDQGEPHTQEHLLLGKGTKGRAFAGLDTMWLAGSSAFTEQLQTCYHFNTAAGIDVFYDLFAAQIDALLHPNYSDEEIRREVCNFGVAEAADGSLRLEEKGTVYNEMVSSTGNPYWKLFRASGQQIYGPTHPLSYNAGGEPSGIRTMKPEDIRRFHDANYYLANMGTIAAFPSTVPLNGALARMGSILDRAEPGPKTPRQRVSESSMPEPKPASAGSIDIEEYPHKNPEQPSPIMLAWPANRTLDTNEALRLDLFVAAIASDPTTNLYKLFIDSKTRKMDIGAASVFGLVSQHQGHAIQIGFTDVDASNLTTEKLAAVGKAVADEIARIAAFPDGSPALKEFNGRIATRLTQAERDFAKFVNTPPRFGARDTGPSWMDSLFRLEETDEFRRSVTYKPQVAAVRALLATNENFWKQDLAKWKITGVMPYVSAAKPSPALLKREESDRVARCDAETARLAKGENASSAQEAIRLYRVKYDAESAKIEEEADKVPRASFVKSPPMTLDDALVFQKRTLDGGVPLVVSRFDNMSSATTGIALRLDAVPREQLRYVSLLPALLTSVGVIEGGKPVSYDEMSERLRNEILGLDASFTSNPRTDRVELMVHGSGLGDAEAARALDWMSLVLNHPDWRPDNLPRIRDVVDQSLSALRNTMQGPEESWVLDPATAYREQSVPAFLAAESALTAEHNALRLRWLLKEAPADSADAEALAAFLTKLAQAGKTASRDDLKAFLTAASAEGESGSEASGEGAAGAGEPSKKEGGEAKAAAAKSPDAAAKTSSDDAAGSAPAAVRNVPGSLKPFAEALAALPPPARSIANEALEDLDLTLIDIPDQSLAADWAYLCAAIRDDLKTPPATALANLDAVRRLLLKTAGARMFLVGSPATEAALAPKIAALVASLDKTPAPRPATTRTAEIDARLRTRDPDATRPVYVGLIAPNMQGGVIVTSVPGTAFSDAANRAKQLDYLATRLYAGYGAHGIFLKTIGAGLAYSNGLRASVSSGRMGYYAERTPDLAQTVKFVVDTLKSEPRDPALGEYAVAQVFAEFRSAGTYEARAEGIAADLADGQPPELVRKFRESILVLSRQPELGNTLFDLKDKVNGRFIPGYNVKGGDVTGAVYFVIGPDRQLDSWERYLQTAESTETKLYRLYPRDFWLQ